MPVLDCSCFSHKYQLRFLGLYRKTNFNGEGAEDAEEKQKQKRKIKDKKRSLGLKVSSASSVVKELEFNLPPHSPMSFLQN